MLDILLAVRTKLNTKLVLCTQKTWTKKKSDSLFYCTKFLIDARVNRSLLMRPSTKVIAYVHIHMKDEYFHGYDLATCDKIQRRQWEEGLTIKKNIQSSRDNEEKKSCAMNIWNKRMCWMIYEYKLYVCNVGNIQNSGGKKLEQVITYTNKKKYSVMKIIYQISEYIFSRTLLQSERFPAFLIYWHPPVLVRIEIIFVTPYWAHIRSILNSSCLALT